MAIENPRHFILKRDSFVGALREWTHIGPRIFCEHEGVLRPYRASRLTGSLPRLKPGLGSLTASR